MTLKKTNAARLLDERGIRYALRAFDVDEADLSATRAAISLGAAPEQVFKTLVARGDRKGVLLACIPAQAALDLKVLAVASGNKTVQLVPLKEVFALTGYMRGGCSPVGTKKNYPVFLDTSAILYTEIYVSAGQRGLQFLLAPDELIAATQASLADITSE